MGKELPLARQEAEGQSVLLAITGSGESIFTSSSGNERKEEANPSKGEAGREVEDTPSKSKRSSKAKRANASSSKAKGRGRDNKDRESDRGDEGEDSRPRRNSYELGIEYPSPFCDENGNQPHRWMGVDKVDCGTVFRCQRCLRHKWLPLALSDALKLGNLMEALGVTAGYQMYLNRHRAAKVMVAKLQDLWHIRQRVKDDKEFARIVYKVMTDKEYDRKE